MDSCYKNVAVAMTNYEIAVFSYANGRRGYYYLLLLLKIIEKRVEDR